MFPPCIGESILGNPDLFWPSKADTGIKQGAIAFSAVATDAPGFLKEFDPRYGLVWRRISAEEIQHRRKTTLWA
jgi:hypothetical protein